MTSTNKTESIKLSQYIGSDIPSYLGDYNGDMLKIDQEIGQLKTKVNQSSESGTQALEKVKTIEAELKIEKEKIKTNQENITSLKQEDVNMNEFKSETNQTLTTLNQTLQSLVNLNLQDEIMKLKKNESKEKRDITINNFINDTKYPQLPFTASLSFEGVDDSYLANANIDLLSQYQGKVLIETDTNILRFYVSENKELKFNWLSIKKGNI